jgi:hypothetical protein
MNRRILALLLGTLVAEGALFGYAVGPALTLDQLAARSDLVFKGTVVSTAPEPGQGAIPGFHDQSTVFHVISVVKGTNPGPQLRFRHQDSGSPPGMVMYEPQHYHFEPGRSYLVFARRGDSAGVFQPFSDSPTGKADQGAILCADDRPVRGATLHDILWSELTALLASSTLSDVVYGINQLDEESGGGWENTGAGMRFGSVFDFDRKDVLAAIHGFIGQADPGIAQAALGAVGSHNPYMSEERAPFWLDTVGSAKLQGLAGMNPQFENLGGKLYTHEIAAVAGSPRDEATRALAVRALGLVRDPLLEKPLANWLASSSAMVRSAAATLLADFPDLMTDARIKTLAGDPAPEVRIATAHAIGFAQQAGRADVLAKLLGDTDAKVRQAAAMSLLSFSPRDDAIATIFQANVENPEFFPLFLNALAAGAPAAHLDDLARAATSQDMAPPNWWGGETPYLVSWHLLFRYLQAQPVTDLASGKLDRYLDAMEKVRPSGSGEPTEIYAFYVQRGMSGRAKNFRAAADQVTPYDLDMFFQRVDKDPSAYP